MKNGPAGMPLLARVKSLQDAVNLILSNFVNAMQEDPRNTILVLVNYDGQNLGEFRRNLAAYGAVKVRSDAGAPGGDVRTLTMEVNAENYKAVLELLKRAMVENARGYDARDLRAAGTPNEMNLRSVFSDIDLDADMLEAEFQSMFRSLLPFVRACLANEGRPAGEAPVSLVFRRNTIVNEEQVIGSVAQSAGFLSQETLLAHHPWVEDVQREQERLARGKQDGKGRENGMKTEFLQELGLSPETAQQVCEASAREMEEERAGWERALHREQAESRVMLALAKAGARSLEAARALVKTGEDGEAPELDEQIEALKTAPETSFLFEGRPAGAAFRLPAGAGACAGRGGTGGPHARAGDCAGHAGAGRRRLKERLNRKGR